MIESNCEYTSGRFRYYKLLSSGLLTPEQNLYSQSPLEEYIQSLVASSGISTEVFINAISLIAASFFKFEGNHSDLDLQDVMALFQQTTYRNVRRDIHVKGVPHIKGKLSIGLIDEIISDLTRFPKMLEYIGQQLEGEHFKKNGTSKNPTSVDHFIDDTPLSYAEWIGRRVNNADNVVKINGSVLVPLLG